MLAEAGRHGHSSSRRARGSTPTRSSRSRSRRWCASTATTARRRRSASPPIAYAEGRCVGGSTEINSGLWHRLPDDLADEWRAGDDIDEFDAATLDRLRRRASRAGSPSAARRWRPPLSSALLERGAAKLGWRSVEFPRVFRYGDGRPGGEADDGAHADPAGGRRRRDGARRVPRHAPRARRRPRRRREGLRARPDGGPDERITDPRRARRRVRRRHPDAGPAPAQRLPAGRSARGLKLHPTIKIAARFPHPVDHDDVPMHRITEFAPNLTIGGSRQPAGSRRPRRRRLRRRPAPPRLADWEHLSVYYAAIRSDAGGRVRGRARAPRPARDLPAHRRRPQPAGARARPPRRGAAGRRRDRAVPVGRSGRRWRTDVDDLGLVVGRRRPPALEPDDRAPHVVGPDGRGPELAGADSFGRVHGTANLRVNDASLLPDAPGVNPQAAIMTIAARNADAFLAQLR